MYMPELGRFTARDPMPEDGVLVGGLPQNSYWYANNNPLNMADPSGLAAEPVFDNSCSLQEQACIIEAWELADKILTQNEQSVKANCPDNKPMSCDLKQLVACIRNALTSVKIACANRGEGGCHKGQKNLGHTDTPCGRIKGLASIGILCSVATKPTFPMVTKHSMQSL